MNPLYSEFKRKFAISMYKNMGIALGEMSFLKDFVHDTRGDLYPLVEKSDDAVECVEKNRYRLTSGKAERVFCQFFPFASYEIEAEALCGEVGFVFRLPECMASVTLCKDDQGVRLIYRSKTKEESIELPEDFDERSPWLVTCRPSFFDIYYRENGGAKYVTTVEEPLFAASNRYASFKDGYVSLLASGQVTVSRVTSCLDNGVSIADFRVIKYEDGTILYENGKVFFTASVRTHADSYQAIFSWVPATMQLEMTGVLFFDKGDGFWRGYIASTLLYDRAKEQWYVLVSSFGHEHIIAYGAFDADPRFGIGVVDVTLMERAAEGDPFGVFAGVRQDEDPDLIYDKKNDRWLLAICRIDPDTGRYRYVFFASKEPFHGYTCIGYGVQPGADETGGLFVVANGDIHFICGNSFDRRSEYRIYDKNGVRLARFRYPDGGFRGWGCVIPVKLGSRTRYFWLTFDRHNGSSYNWSYGNFYCFEAEE